MNATTNTPSVISKKVDGNRCHQQKYKIAQLLCAREGNKDENKKVNRNQ